MRIKPIASLLICGATLVAVSPSRAFAQTVAQPAAVRSEQNLTVARSEMKPLLKDAFVEEVEKNKAGGISSAEIKRLEKGWLAQSTPKQHSWSKKNTVLVVLIVVVIVGLAIVLEHNGVNPVTSCDEDPLAPDCVP